MMDMQEYQVKLKPEVRNCQSRFKSKDGQPARPKIDWQYAGFAPTSSEAIAINESLESFGRKLIAANGDNWEYIPNPNVCNLETLKADLERERSGWTRTVTKETLGKLAAYYKDAAVRILGKTKAAASAGADLIYGKLAAAQGKPDVAKVFRNNLIDIIEGETDAALIEPHAAVIDKLLEMLEDLEVSETVDAEAL